MIIDRLTKKEREKITRLAPKKRQRGFQRGRRRDMSGS